jgi:proline iminopeptidase
MEIYVGPDAQGLALPAEELPEDIQARAGRFAEEITRTPGFSESLLPYLERLTQPALLIKGGHDPVTSAEEIDLFQAKVPNGRFQLFDTAGHFVHAEQPEAYARLVTDFILGSPPPHDGTGRTAGTRPTARTEEQAVQPRG